MKRIESLEPLIGAPAKQLTACLSKIHGKSPFGKKRRGIRTGHLRPYLAHNPEVARQWTLWAPLGMSLLLFFAIPKTVRFHLLFETKGLAAMRILFSLAEIAQMYIKPKTANRYREILTRLFNWATTQYGVRLPGEKNPAAAVEQ